MSYNCYQICSAWLFIIYLIILGFLDNEVVNYSSLIHQLPNCWRLVPYVRAWRGFESGRKLCSFTLETLCYLPIPVNYQAYSISSSPGGVIGRLRFWDNLTTESTSKLSHCDHVVSLIAYFFYLF
jgi:hypothetical protein